MFDNTFSANVFIVFLSNRCHLQGALALALAHGNFRDPRDRGDLALGASFILEHVGQA